MTKLETQLFVKNARRQVSPKSKAFFDKVMLSNPEMILLFSGKRSDEKFYEGWLVASDLIADRYIVLSQSPWQQTLEWFVLDGRCLYSKTLKDCPSFVSLNALMDCVIGFNERWGQV